MTELKDFDSLGPARAHTEVVERTQSPDVVIAMLTEHDSVLTLQEKALTDDKAAGFLLALSGPVSVYDIREGSAMGIKQRELLEYLVYLGAVTQAFRDAAIASSSTTVKPFENTTQIQLNQAKGIYTEEEVIDYVQGKNVKITLIDTLPENCTATTWAKDLEFGYENNCKIAHLKTDTSVYKLRMDSKRVDGKLFVRIPMENFNFTVEMI